MTNIFTNARRKILIYVLLFLGIILYSNLGEVFQGPPGIRGTLTTFGYIALLLSWANGLRRRVLAQPIRRKLICCAGLMIAWMFFRICKYDYFSHLEVLDRQMWYAYYIPLILIPLFCLLLALSIGEEDSFVPYRANLLWIPACALLAGILTNDLHQQAFHFLPGMAQWNDRYRYGWLYFCAVIWIGFLLCASVGILLRRSRIRHSRRQRWVPFFWILVLAVYSVCYMQGPLFFSWRLIQMPEADCLLFAALIESCILIGLIPSNLSYDKFFDASSVGAQITDSQGQVMYASETARRLNPMEKREAADRCIWLDEHTQLCGKRIAGGCVYWENDLEMIHQIRDELAEIRENLSGEKDLLVAENEMKEQWAALEEQNRLYDSILQICRPQMSALEKLLDELEGGCGSGRFRSRLGEACICAAYIKRRSNLCLMEEKEEGIAAEELALCFRESAEYLKLYGTAASFRLQGNSSCLSAYAGEYYEFFQRTVEEVLPVLSAVLITLTVTEQITELRLGMELKEARSLRPALYPMDRYAAEGLVLTAEEEDGAYYLSLSQKGGEKA
jgi:hypothetical protein